MKKIIKLSLSVVLIVALVSQTVVGAFAASSKKEYVSEVILSYGDNGEEAKKWLTEKGYKYVDSDLNKGADDAIFLSKARSVYMGYKTTTNPDEAITDMKLMNMSGGYSVQDYKMILAEKKTDIKQFLSQFVSVLSEYRANYENGSSRAEAAHEMLNMIKEDDTGMLMGDLLLNKIKEEYSDDDFSALSEEEQKKHADMTTVLMQGNAEMVLYIEQILATATDTNETLWLDRLADASDYDTMLEAVMDEEDVTPDEAESILAAEYDDDAKMIASYATSYREWLKGYSDSGVSFYDNESDVTEYINSLSDAEKGLWYAEGAQYEMLKNIAYDDEISLLDLFISDDFDISGDDVYLLYPIVSVLTDGQRNALDFLSGYQFFAMGCNTDAVTLEAKTAEVATEEKGTVSVYAGVDRSIYGDDVALTGDAYQLQSSTDKDYTTNWFDDGLSATTKVLGIVTASVITVTIGAFVTGAVFSAKVNAIRETVREKVQYFYDNSFAMPDLAYNDLCAEVDTLDRFAKAPSYWSKVFNYAGIGLTVCSILLSAYTLWKSYNELKAYYKSDFTPIPLWMVDQGVDENDEKIFTYYKAVECNRVEKNFTADNTKLLGNLGDINGDVGKQWLALYTTKDENAGDPILADFKVQVGSSKIPGEYTALSLFGSKSAQNLTDEKSGFTYNDSEGGIYIFYNTDTSIFAGSSITTGICAAAAGGVVALGAVVFLVIRRKKAKSTAKAED